MFVLVAGLICAFISITVSLMAWSNNKSHAIKKPKLSINFTRGKYEKELGYQIVDSLAMLANSMKAGLTLIQGLQNLANEVKDPLGKEFRTITAELSLGCSLEDALSSMARRMNHEDINLAATAILVQRQTGGNLAKVLMTLSDTIRERQRVQDKLNSATTQGKFSGAVIVGLPPVMAIVINLIQPGFYQPVIEKPIGWIIMLIALTMDIMGGLALKKICEVKF